jgi:hypothetical protein
MKANKTIIIVCCALLAIVWGVLAGKTFNSKPDLNGDNINYYIYATSLATGHGYSDLSHPQARPTSNFPPGYPLLMTPLRVVTDSIVAQKWLNEVFVLAGVLLIFFTLLRLGMRWDVSLLAAAAGLFAPRLWHFSTMMMSEASFFLTSAFVFYALARYFITDKEDKRWWTDVKQPWLWAMIVVLVLNYHIRTQGLALVAGVGLLLLCRRRWVALGTTIIGFILGCLPYMMRNKLLGLNGNRYMDTIMLKNPFQPDAGSLTFTEVIERFFSTLKMLVFNAIPNTIFPYLKVNCDQPEYSFWIYVAGALVLAVILIGYWSMGSIRWGMIGYLAATLGLISIFSTPSGNRYITSVLPLLAAGLICGIWQLAEWILTNRKKWLFTGCALVLCLLFIPAKAGIQEEITISKQKYPLPYTQFFNMGKQLKKKVPAGTVVCSRKPQLFWMESGLPGVNYKYTKDARELVAHLVDNRVDYVVLDALGYSSTPLYLYPAIQRYPHLFPQAVMYYENTHMYLLYFDRERAMLELAQDD